ncbi:hypothetical protein I3843_06G040300 [Carya illinoinensis]|uniref:Nephrocystin-3 n=2 Tax=Carya illinoinensis TaxID=32201 RepID=A0A8T1Q7T7_CARIL|nr:nephrocystin-3 isoform X1 [Carya illinoinensis]KAG6650458.1 hypothetical protein CIPAW_06G045100 [Carya illinoinensis]KAG6707693.1 hypothetical protein I3842_06G044700 [Carya illinoinensis]KAG7974268.1 hypothetical protein I3843_06G040300 [Carya illinoinensis]
MSTSLISLSPSTNNYRMSQVCLHMQSEHLRKAITCFSVCHQKQKCNIKHYMIPIKAVSGHRVYRTFASVGSLEADVASHGNDAPPGVSTPNNSRRSRMSFDQTNYPLDDMTNFEKQLQELFDEVKRMIMMGNRNDAMDLLKANYEAVIERMNKGSKGIEEAALLDIITLGYMAVGDLKFVASLLAMLAEVVDSLKDNEPLLDVVLVHMGSLFSALGKFDRSLLVYQRSIDILENRYGKNSIFLVTPLLGMAKALGSIGRSTKAVEIYHRAITILELSKGAESEDLVVALFGLGNLLLKEGRSSDAEPHFIRILTLYKKLYGENDGRVGMAMCSLAHVKCAKGNADEAIGLYKNALQVIKDSNYMALDDSIMEKMRIDLAELLHVVGRGKEGREMLEESLLITEKYKGKEHPSLVTHFVNLATSYSRSKNFVEAERLLRMSLEIMGKTVGPDDQSLTYPMLHLAVTLYNLKRNEEAEQLALDVLHIREKAFGKDSLPVGEALDCLASIQTRLGRDYGELLELLKRLLSIQEREFGHESEEVMETLKKTLYYLDKLGRKNEKFPLQKRLSMLRMKYKERIQY